MSNTNGALYADLPHQGGWLWVPAVDLSSFSANLVLTRNALGDYSYNRTAAGAETYNIVCNLGALKRLIESPTAPMPFQEQFGAAAGTAGYPASAPGIPPFSGATQLTVPTGFTPKGVRVLDVCASYQVGVVDATTITLSLNRIVYSSNVANAITNVPIDATALLKTAAGDATGPYFAKRTVTTPVFETTDQSDLLLELAVTLANTGTLRVYGLGFHVDLNYN